MIKERELLVAVMLILLSPALSIAEDVKAPAAPVKEVVKEIKKLTRSEILADLKDDLASEDEIFNYVRGLGKAKGPDGKETFTFKKGDKDLPIDELDEDTLRKLSASVNQIVTKLRTDRIQDQLETIRQAQKIQSVTRAPVAPASTNRQTLPKTPPSVPSVPKVPTTSTVRR